jgi:TRAP-type C4-dicarboxylate transport system substrate-binding protein
MKQKRKMFIVMVCFYLFSMFALVPLHGADAKPTSWKFFISYPPSLFPILPNFPDMVKKHTNGQLEVNLFFHGEHPYKGSDIMKALKKRHCEMGEIEGIYNAGYEPVLALTGTPMVAGSVEQMFDMHEALLKQGALDTVYDKYNIFEAAYWVWFGPTISTIDTLVNDMDSLKGKKIRVPSKQHADVVKWLGGSPVTISWGEVYTALQLGVIDGDLGSMSGQKNSKWTEVCKYSTRMAEAFGMDRIAINRDAYAELSPEVQKGLMKAVKEYEKQKRVQMRTDDALAAISVMHDDGVTMRAMPKEIMKKIQQKAKPYMEEWAGKSGKGAPEANKVLMEVLGW